MVGDKLEEDLADGVLTLSASLPSRPMVRNGRLLRAAETSCDDMVLIKYS